jgi:hypothetical protein
MAADLALVLRRRGPRDRRFAAAFGVLALLPFVVGGVTAWSVARFGVERAGAGGFSSWQPSLTGFEAAREIGAKVGEGAAVAFPVPFTIGQGGGPDRLRAVAVRERGGALRLEETRTIGFSLCGPAKTCALQVDTYEQRLLARREGLEVALYSLKYLDVDRVVVLLPPRPEADHPATALFFRRADLAARLDAPLRATVGARPPTVSRLDGAAGHRLERLTAPYFYAVGYATAAGAGPVITLSPMEAE